MAITEIVTFPSSQRPDQNFGPKEGGSGRSELDIRAGLSGRGACEEQSIIQPEKAGRREVIEPPVKS